MKYFLHTIIFLCLFSIANAGPIQDRHKAVIQMYCAGGGGCNPASNEVGDRTTDYAQSYNVPSTGIYCLPYTADCTGTLGYSYVIHVGAVTDNGKVCVYSKNSTGSPDVNDLKISCSNEFTATGAETAQSDAKLTGSVTNAAEYWVCILGGANSFQFEANSGGAVTMYSIASGINYATPPNNLDGSWSSDSTTDAAVYVEIE